MRRQHFVSLQPVCPRCRAERQADIPLVLATVIRETESGVMEGVIHCPDAACRLEYPIVDGIPIIVPRIRQFLSDNFFAITARADLSDTIEGVLGDGTGPGTWFDSVRQHVSTYAWDHYGDLDPAETTGQPEPASVVRCLEHGLDLLERPSDPPTLDLGCSVGRSAFALADRMQGLVLGVDVDLSMLRIAQAVLHGGRVRYARRRVGIVYDRREFDVEFAGADRVDFWACDALALPFAAASFGLVAALNVLDTVPSPLAFLAGVRDALRTGGRAILSTPFDWAPASTPPEAWIGGHSQRGPDAGASEPFLRSLLTAGAHPQSVPGFELLAEADVPWHTRLHDRSSVSYTAHLLLAARTGSTGS